MTFSVPRNWFIAHRCVDLSADFGKAAVGSLIAENADKENTLSSMESRFADGFGVETDLRGDSMTEQQGILISHNPLAAKQDYPSLEEVFSLYTKFGKAGCLALNIKDAGLQGRLKPLLDRFGIENYFTFDGANPDVLVDIASGIRAFGRESEIEPFNASDPIQPLSNYPGIKGVWLDNFKPDFWISSGVVEKHFKNGKDVAIVSPELHPWAREDQGATMLGFWKQYRETIQALAPHYPERRMMLCTKLPTLAFGFFNEGV